MTADDPFPPLFDEFQPISTETWEKKVQEDLGTDETESFLRWDSIDGVSLSAYQGREDVTGIPHLDDNVDVPPISRSADWHIRQDVTHGDPSEVQRLATAAIESGCTDLGFSLNPVRDGVGVARPDFDKGFSGLIEAGYLEDVHVHLDRGVGAVVLLKLLERTANQDISTLSGSISYDPVAAVATGSIGDPRRAFGLAADLLREGPPAELRTLCVDMRPFHDAGASVVQELAFGLGSLTATLAQLDTRETPLSSVASRLHLLTSVSTSYFVEIAKLRALRLLVPQIVDAFANETKDPAYLAPNDVFVQSETSRRSKTVYDPYVNMLRGTTEAMASVLGGADVVNVHPYDTCFRPPDTFGTRIARNVQLILRHEAHFDVVADPAAGSYYVETATDKIARQAWELFQKVEERGGILQTLEDGTLQNLIAEVRARRKERLDERKDIIVGTTHYPNLDERKWSELENTSNPNENTSPELDLEDISLEEIGYALEEALSPSEIVMGFCKESSSVEPLPQLRISEDYERLRLRTEAYAEETGRCPLVLLAPIGPTGPRSARATFARNVFGVAGFDIDEQLQFESAEAAVSAAATNGADVLVLCSSDDAYPALVSEAKAALRTHSINPVLAVAGDPNQIEATLDVDRFIYQGMPLRRTLISLQEELGIRG